MSKSTRSKYCISHALLLPHVHLPIGSDGCLSDLRSTSTSTLGHTVFIPVLSRKQKSEVVDRCSAFELCKEEDVQSGKPRARDHPNNDVALSWTASRKRDSMFCIEAGELGAQNTSALIL